MKDKLARDPGPVKRTHLGSTPLTLSRNPILGLTPIPILNLAPTPVPAATNDLFKQFIKAYLEMNQGPKQPPAEPKQFFKAKIPEVYYGKLYIDYYYFCQKCKD